MIYDLCLYEKNADGLLVALYPPYKAADTKSGYLNQLIYAFLITDYGSNATDPAFGSNFVSTCKQLYSNSRLVERVVVDILRAAMKNFITWYYLNVLNSFVAPTEVDTQITLLNATIENRILTVQVGLSKLDDTSVSCRYQFDLTT